MIPALLVNIPHKYSTFLKPWMRSFDDFTLGKILISRFFCFFLVFCFVLICFGFFVFWFFLMEGEEEAERCPWNRPLLTPHSWNFSSWRGGNFDLQRWIWGALQGIGFPSGNPSGITSPVIPQEYRTELLGCCTARIPNPLEVKYPENLGNPSGITSPVIPWVLSSWDASGNKIFWKSGKSFWKSFRNNLTHYPAGIRNWAPGMLHRENSQSAGNKIFWKFGKSFWKSFWNNLTHYLMGIRNWAPGMLLKIKYSENLEIPSGISSPRYPAGIWNLFRGFCLEFMDQNILSSK